MICWIIFKDMIIVKKGEVGAKVGAEAMEEGIEIEGVEVGAEAEKKEKEEKKKRKLLIKKKMMDIITSLVMI